ncbi:MULTISPECIES: LLM class flavin-dependent oxidoreductase [unclassified Streptomyces]|uniref:LLM class flavin-dependent oxidoreductase n=1 Tax=unclassified Streptomyces TaxID=2593676 RepID=UPI00068BFD80|nr:MULTISPECIES: LLM class flavin-dependent oxidoreductase [unclassified Streptomyces]
MTLPPLEVYGTMEAPHADAGDSLGHIAGLARRAEKHRLDGLLVFYNHRSPDPWAVASAILHSTERLVPLVAVQPYSLPPFTAAKLIHTLSTLHRRRVDINLITGATEADLAQLGEGLGHDERYARAEEFCDVLMALLSTDKALDHDGRFYRYASLRTHSFLEPEHRPRVFVAGSSSAGVRAAAAVADVAVTHPEPVARFAETLAERGPARARPAIRVGLIARATDEEAWAVARARYPEDRRSRAMTLMRTHARSDWSRRLARLATATEDGTYDEVYWTGAYRANRDSMPLLVGSHQRVADYLERYVATGVSTVLLGALATEEDFQHAVAVLSRVRRTRTGRTASPFSATTHESNTQTGSDHCDT